MIYRACAFAAVVMLAAEFPSHAQEASPPPVLRDLPESETLPKDGTFDLLGIRLGAAKPEVLAKFKELAPHAQPDSPTEILTLRDSRGNSIQHAYDTSASVEFAHTDGSRERIEALFTTRLNEVRVMRLYRAVRYPQHAQASVPAFMASLEKKYGKASYEDRAGRTVTLYYIWDSGQRIHLTEQVVRTQRFSNAPAHCMNADVSKYIFNARRVESYPTCTTLMRVEIQTGKRDDLAESVTFILNDRARAMHNTRESDQWLLEEMRKAIKGQAGAQPPRL